VALVLVATDGGCRAFTDAGEAKVEIENRQVVALARERTGTCLAVIDGQEIRRRSSGGVWSTEARSSVALQSILSVNGVIFGGSTTEGIMVRMRPGMEAQRLTGFDKVQGRNQWFCGGPTPLHVRALTSTADGSAILAAVHVGGIPRSADGGETWTPTLPVKYDVHEVQAHASLPRVAAAAAAVGLCMSYDSGRSWSLIKEGLEMTDSLAVAVLGEEVLFSIQEGPFAKQSQVWRYPISGGKLEQVRDGLPGWLEGKVDTARMATNQKRTAILDFGGNLYLSGSGSRDWVRIATGLPYAYGVVVV
jgi:hypothetical protein